MDTGGVDIGAILTQILNFLSTGSTISSGPRK